jgi:hypothetical protein
MHIPGFVKGVVGKIISILRYIFSYAYISQAKDIESVIKQITYLPDFMLVVCSKDEFHTAFRSGAKLVIGFSTHCMSLIKQ